MKVFVDLDGVLVNFDQAVKDIDGATGLSDTAKWADKLDMYKKIDAAGLEFWSKMAWMPGGKKLWGVVKKYNPSILSSPGKFKYAVAGKTEWMKNNLPGVTFHFSDNKEHWAERDAVLIDDRNNNIQKWIAAGGTGILYDNVPDTEQKLLELLLTHK